MASITLKNAYLSINSQDLSDHVASVTLNLNKDTPEDTAMGDNSRSFKYDGLKNATLEVTFNADYAASEVDAHTWTVYQSDAAVPFIVKPSGATTGAANPKWTGDCGITSWAPISGSVGALGTTTVSYQISGDVARAVSDA